MNTLEQTIDALVKLKKNGPQFQHDGICAHVYSVATGSRLLNLAFQYWPKFTGSFMCPIPSSIEGFSPVMAYHNLDKWNKYSVYGQNRWELVDFVIQFLKQCDIVVVTNTTVYPVNEVINDDSIMFGDVFFVVVHYPSLPDELQDLEFLVDCWNKKKDVDDFFEYCVKL